MVGKKERIHSGAGLFGPLRNLYLRSSLAQKIRVSYVILLLPVLVLLIVALFSLWRSNRQYGHMIHSAVEASRFSLDFQKDYDYETYLLIVGNKTPEESTLDEMLKEAGQIVNSLEGITDGESNRKRMASVRKYLTNLESYQRHIEENLAEGNRYDDNIRIWENDVQIVTSLIRETFFEYIYYEIRDLQASHDEYQMFFMTMIRILVILFVALVALIILMSYIFPKSITRPIRQLEAVTDQVAKGDLLVRSEVRTDDEVGALSDSLNVMIDKINDLLAQVTTEQIRLRKAEFRLLQSQINPHFLYNTLDAIVWLAEAGQMDEVVRMVGSLSAFFRTSLNQGRDIVTLREELQHVRSYLEIQQTRYQDILQYEIEVPDTLDPCLIPKITIQPLVENALYHGVKNKRGKGRITVSGSREDGVCRITVEDNGIGMSRERLARVQAGIRDKEASGSEVYGLYNVNERIRLNFGDPYGISIDSEEGKGTRVTILLPGNAAARSTDS